MNTQNEQFNFSETGIEELIFRFRPYCKIQEGNIMGNSYAATRTALTFALALVNYLHINSCLSPIGESIANPLIKIMMQDLQKFSEQNKF